MIKVRLNPNGTFRVVHWTPFLYAFNWKIIKHFNTPAETKEYLRKITENDKSKLDIKPDAFKKLYQE